MNGNFSSDFQSKVKKEEFNFLRLQRNSKRLEMTEESPFFGYIGKSMEIFFDEVTQEQNDFYPSMKNEYLFIKEIIESKQKHVKVK